MQIFTQDDIQHIAAFGTVPVWTASCALAGYSVRIYWLEPETEDNARNKLRAEFDALLRQGKASANLIDAARARVHFTDDPSNALLDAQFVVAAQPDEALVRMVDTYTSPHAVVCCADLNAQQLECSRHPERWLALVDGVPISLLQTAPQAFETARMLYFSIL